MRGPSARLSRSRWRWCARNNHFLNQLERDSYRVNSLQWHYFKYKYYYGEPLTSPEDFNRRFDRVLGDKNARVYKPGERYIIHSEAESRWALIAPTGQRISIYTPTLDELAKESLNKSPEMR